MVVALYLVGISLICFSLYLFWFSPSNQSFGQFIWRKPTTEKIVALTFDDGPNPPYTNHLLDILQRHGVRVTFFLVGKNLERSPEIGRRMIAEGHQIGNHSYQHSFWQYIVHPRYFKELTRAQEVITQITGQQPIFFRPPWLFRQPWLLSSATKLGLTTISGIFGSEFEIFQPPAERMARRAVQKTRPGSILIFHDGYNASGGNRAETVRAIDLLIPQLQHRGYRFVTLDEIVDKK